MNPELALSKSSVWSSKERNLNASLINSNDTIISSSTVNSGVNFNKSSNISSNKSSTISSSPNIISTTVSSDNTPFQQSITKENDQLSTQFLTKSSTIDTTPSTVLENKLNSSDLENKQIKIIETFNNLTSKSVLKIKKDDYHFENVLKKVNFLLTNHSNDHRGDHRSDHNSDHSSDHRNDHNSDHINNENSSKFNINEFNQFESVNDKQIYELEDTKLCFEQDSWPTTECSESAISNCTYPYTGLTYRLCYSSCQWSKVDTSQCKLAHLAEIHNLVGILNLDYFFQITGCF